MQEISLPENCVNCIERAAAAGVGFSCLALQARAALSQVNAEAEGLAELEATRSDIATPILRQMLGAAVARSISDTSLPNALIEDTEKKMADCAGPLIEVRTHKNKLYPTHHFAKSLVFAARDYVFDETTGKATEAAVPRDHGQDTIYTYDTSLLDRSKFERRSFERWGVQQEGIFNTGGTTEAGDSRSAEALENYGRDVLKAAAVRWEG